jgi:hypothetical protein
MLDDGDHHARWIAIGSRGRRRTSNARGGIGRGSRTPRRAVTGEGAGSLFIVACFGFRSRRRCGAPPWPVVAALPPPLPLSLSTTDAGRMHMARRAARQRLPGGEQGLRRRVRRGARAAPGVVCPPLAPRRRWPPLPAPLTGGRRLNLRPREADHPDATRRRRESRSPRRLFRETHFVL